MPYGHPQVEMRRSEYHLAKYIRREGQLLIPHPGLEHRPVLTYAVSAQYSTSWRTETLDNSSLVSRRYRIYPRSCIEILTFQSAKM